MQAPVDTSNMMIAMVFEEQCIDFEAFQKCFPTKNNTYTKGEKYKDALKQVIFESDKNLIEDALEVIDFSFFTYSGKWKN